LIGAAVIAGITIALGPVIIDLALETILQFWSPSAWWCGLLAIGWVLTTWVIVALPPESTTNTFLAQLKSLGFQRPTPIEVAALHAIVIVLYSLMLDCGEHARACFYGELGYAAGAILVVARRARSLTAGDLLYLRWGGQAIISLTVPVAIEVWRVRAS
jgi:hypothetical protein